MYFTSLSKKNINIKTNYVYFSYFAFFRYGNINITD